MNHPENDKPTAPQRHYVSAYGHKPGHDDVEVTPPKAIALTFWPWTVAAPDRAC